MLSMLHFETCTLVHRPDAQHAVPGRIKTAVAVGGTLLPGPACQVSIFAIPIANVGIPVLLRMLC